MRTATADVPEPANATPNPPAVETLRPGARLGPYELLSPLASGGMGHVWSALRIGDFGFRRTVAIKVMREELAADPSFRKMFLDEARLASRVSHTNVVEVLDLGESGGILFLAMALVEGDSLAHLVHAAREKGATLPSADVVARIVADVLRGLHAAHSLRGDDGVLLELVHRDVSPQNILVGLDGTGKITDFGVAKAEGAAIEAASQSHRKGKVGYMPPEQFNGLGVDRRSDVYAAGVVLWELLAGTRLPSAHRGTDAGLGIPHPCEVNAHAHRALGDVAMRAVRAEREQRWASAEDMADAIESAAHASGLVLSSKAVAAWVASLAEGRILRRRHDTEAQLARTLATAATHFSAESAPRATETKTRRWWLGALAIAAMISVAALARVLGGRTQPEVAAASLAVAPTAIPIAATIASDTPSPSAASASSGTPTTPPATTASAPAASAPRTRAPGRAPRGPSPPPKPTPRYANPYEGATP